MPSPIHDLTTRPQNTRQRNAQLFSIALVGTQPNPGPGHSGMPQAQVFHWRFYARPLNERNSILFDMIPANYPFGVLHIEPRSGLSTSSPYKLERELILRKWKTSADLAKLLDDNGFARYRFTDDGEGCRYWCMSVIKKLESEGWLVPGTVKDIETWVQEQWNMLGQACLPIPPPQGEFY